VLSMLVSTQAVAERGAATAATEAAAAFGGGSPPPTSPEPASSPQEQQLQQGAGQANVVTVLVSKASGRYRLQGAALEPMWLVGRGAVGGAGGCLALAGCAALLWCRVHPMRAGWAVLGVRPRGWGSGASSCCASEGSAADGQAQAVADNRWSRSPACLLDWLRSRQVLVELVERVNAYFSGQEAAQVQSPLLAGQQPVLARPALAWAYEDPLPLADVLEVIGRKQ
jgi:hypothetical protein